MLIPIVRDIPLVRRYARNFKSFFARDEAYQNFKTYLNGLIIVPKKNVSQFALYHIFRSDRSNLDHFMNSFNWQAEDVNQRRLQFMKKQTRGFEKQKSGILVIDDTLAPHVGSLFEYIDKHYDHCDGQHKRAHNPVTSLYINGSVRYPVGLELYRRYEEYTNWEALVKKHFPNHSIPKTKKERKRFHQQVDPVLLKDPEFKKLHDAFGRVKFKGKNFGEISFLCPVTRPLRSGKYYIQGGHKAKCQLWQGQQLATAKGS